MHTLRPFFILFSFFIMSCQQMNSDKLDLKTMNWTLHSLSDSLIIDSVNPGDVHMALMSKGIIQDPFFRDNEKKVQWVGETNWSFNTAFDVQAAMFRHDEISLVFEGLDTYAEVWINNSLVLKSDNMFRRWEIP
ncbi:MAG: glycoside hydrolase family 2 protein, partial [Bacteroidetes bacterium]|nr:glycoside hydrolase family 2 protein [Bacteroidota bacterium]